MRIVSLLLLFAVIDAKKKNPWKKTVGQPKSTPSQQIYSDLTNKVKWAVTKMKKYASAETIIASQIALVLGISIIGALFRQVKSKKTKNGIKREKFILLINLGYDKFESTEEIDEIVGEDKLCELIPEDDFDVVRALLLWDYTDEMELEEDEHDDLRNSWNKFALDFRSSESNPTEETSKIGLWRKHFDEQNIVDVARKIFI